MSRGVRELAMEADSMRQGVLDPLRDDNDALQRTSTHERTRAHTHTHAP